MAAVQPLKGVLKHDMDTMLYPTWTHSKGLLPGVVVINVEKIQNVVALLHESFNERIKHLVPPREPIWDYQLVSEVELKKLITAFQSSTI
jgi:hypothetical protein